MQQQKPSAAKNKEIKKIINKICVKKKEKSH